MQRRGRLWIELYIDSCGAGGQFYVFCDAFEKGLVNNGHRLGNVRFIAPCAHDEISLCGREGGKFTQELLKYEMVPFEFCDVVEKKDIRDTWIDLQYPKNRFSNLFAIKKKDRETLKGLDISLDKFADNRNNLANIGLQEEEWA